MTTTERPTPQQAVLELQARARDHALGDHIDRLERTLARVHSRIDGALVTVIPRALGSGASPEDDPDPTTKAGSGPAS